VKRSVLIIFVNLDVQFEDSPTVVTAVTGSDTIRGVGLCSMQGIFISAELREVVTECWECIYIYIYIY
jgi:hypothetical protein